MAHLPHETESPKALFGVVFGGPSTPWEPELDGLGREVEVAREGVYSPLHVNVVFHVPGPILKPESDYVRTGAFDAARRLLMVQATVPEELPADPSAFALGRLREALECAEAWSKRLKIAGDLRALRGIVDRVSALLDGDEKRA